MKKKLRFAIAQMNPTVGDYPANLRKIVRWMKAADAAGADLVVFPEMALCGYPVWDLANKKRFVSRGLEMLERAAAATRSLKVTAALGFIDFSNFPQTGGPRLIQQPSGSHNAMAWIEKGHVRHRYHKRLLPTYDVFLEDIFFSPGQKSAPIDWKGRRVAPTICEDIWDAQYEIKPLQEMRAQGADFAVNLSASPYYRGVSETRDALIRRQAIHHRMPLLYVNQVGAQDDLIFDGRSMFCDERGHILFRAPAFKEDLFYFDWDSRQRPVEGLNPDVLSGRPREMYEAVVLGIRDYCRKNRFHRVLIGLSGGIDSALVAALAVDALGPKSVLGVTLPGNYSSRGSWEDSCDLAERLGLEFRKHSIREKYEFLVKAYRRDRKREGALLPPKGHITLAMENLQARIRGMELMYLSNDEGRLLLTTGNKSELAMGYCTLYGDMAGGLAVLGDVYKTDVYRLALYRNSLSEVIPRTILSKPPSAELRPDQKDQDSLPDYEVLDEILYHYIEKNKSRDEVRSALRLKGQSSAVVDSVIRKVDHNEYKRRQTPPILRVTEKAWFGRRMPITNRFDG